MPAPAQLHLGLATAPTYRRDDFVVADADREAVARVDGHAAGVLALSGPAGSGKTHLAHAWARTHGARVLDARSPPPFPSVGAVLVDGADAADASGELLFTLINGAAAAGRPLLLTGRHPPVGWSARLPDLRSRLNALPVAELSEPDEAALAGLLTLFFRERGVAASADLVAYLVRRIERSAVAAREAARRLDDLAHATGRPVGRGLARELFESGG